MNNEFEPVPEFEPPEGWTSVVYSMEALKRDAGIPVESTEWNYVSRIMAALQGTTDPRIYVYPETIMVVWYGSFGWIGSVIQRRAH